MLLAWMVCLDTTLGAKQGTLYKVPRRSERDPQDTNVFAKNDFWTMSSCKMSQPLHPSNLSKQL